MSGRTSAFFRITLSILFIASLYSQQKIYYLSTVSSKPLSMFSSSIGFLPSIIVRSINSLYLGLATCHSTPKTEVNKTHIYYNSEIESMLEFANSNNFLEPILAQILHLSYNHKSFYINKGSNDGITEDSIIVNNSGVIGIATYVNKHSTLCYSIEREDVGIPVKVQNSLGIMNYDGSHFIISHFKRNPSFKVGDMVVTSPEINLIVPNVHIGVVEKIESKMGSIKAYVKVDSSPTDSIYVTSIGKLKAQYR